MRSSSEPQPSLLDTLRITARRSAYFVCSALLAACAPAAPTPAALFDTPARPPTQTLTLTLTPPHLTPDTPPLDTPTPDSSICSPLAVLSLGEIPDFITQPFIAPGPIHDAQHPDWVLRDDGHHGVDIGYYKRDGKLFTGTPVLAALAGQVATVVHDRPPYGNMLMLETPFERIPPALVAGHTAPAGASLYTLYAHLQNLQPLAVGQVVACGQPLAETGLSGFTGGPHLHFETRWGPPGETFASMAYYRADASAEEMAAYEKWRMGAVFHLFDAMQLLALP